MRTWIETEKFDDNFYNIDRVNKSGVNKFDKKKKVMVELKIFYVNCTFDSNEINISPFVESSQKKILLIWKSDRDSTNVLFTIIIKRSGIIWMANEYGWLITTIDTITGSNNDPHETHLLGR